MDQRITVTGFMCSGKTTIAGALAGLLDCEMGDLDDWITHREQRSPSEIIEADGEDGFREIETRRLTELLSSTPPGVMALGGGTWTREWNRKLLAEQKYVSVWLDAPFELCWHRIQADHEVRPLARSQAEAQKLYLDRLPTYQLADYRVEVSEGESAGEIASRIAALVSPRSSHS